MDATYMCKAFLKVDGFFNGNNIVDKNKINKNSFISQYCINKKCESNRQRIAALSRYLYMYLYNPNDAYTPYFLMWLSDKLFKIHNKGKDKDNNITLDSAFGKYLRNNVENVNYWNLLENIRGIKNTNLKYMSEFYKLLNYICKTIINYQTNNAGKRSLILNSTEGSNQYMILYENVSKCNSYLHLLDNLKKSYNRFRIQAIIKNRKDPQFATNLQTFTTSSGEDSYFAIGRQTYDFSDPKCQLQYDDNIFETIKNAKAQRDQKNIGDKGEDITLSTQPHISADQTPSQPAGTVDSPSMPDNGADTSGGIDISVGDTQNKISPKGSEQKDSGDDTGNQKSPPNDPINPNDGTSISLTNQGDGSSDSASGIGDMDSGARGPDNGSVGGSDDNQINQGGSEGSDSGQGVKDTEAGGSGSGARGSNDEAKDIDKNPSNTGGVQGDQGDSVGGSSGGVGTTDNSSGASGTQSTSWPSFDIGSSIFGIVSKGVEQLNHAFEFFEEKKEQLIKVTDAIKNLYSTSISNIKNTFNGSINFFNGIIDHISSQPEKVDISDNSVDNKLGSGGTGGGVPTPNDPSPPQKDTSQTPLGTSPTSLPSPDPKDQPNVHQLPQGSPGSQISDQKGQGGSQKPVPVPMIKPGNSGTEVKGNGTTEIGDIYVLKEYKQIGISIIVILIPITLAIMHKYLSSGWRKELKRKKNMKKVINPIGGKRPVQIVISSSSQKKKTKKSINSVYREKSPLLNIYKLMQADPVPFINLFFLLIFFVYKRKDDFLE
ncbi:PIR protein CIR protein [Plasmodium vinckei brucechwatti]|uniref:PIR protein CIR protein n=1 Tax=Plasmodium vinckei brucechwatti TaxID=119398 RepID=A0A6V7RSZ7_PLAVN|nr:PIR protein CIR protein [Plasmodium vinckei brucechwatti]